MIIGFTIGAILVFNDLNFKYASLFLFAAALYQIISLFKYIDRINRDLNRFLTSIKYSDFTQTYFSKNFGSAYGDLYKSISATYNELSSNRIRAEENLQYLNTLIEQVPSGIISYKENGEVELINKAAKMLLNTNTLGNINTFKDGKNYLKQILDNVNIGEEKTIKLNNGIKEKNISIFKSAFKQRNRMYTLVTLKDLEDELEKERLENELNIAQNVQASLLPKEIPFLKNYEMSVLFKPAKRVGGDFYDFFDLGKNRLGIIIGDVSGKGLGAAIYTTLLKGIFQTLAYQTGSTAQLLTKANSLLYQMMDKKSFITVTYAILDTEENTLMFSRAGHEPLLVYENAEKKFVNYRQNGLGLGLDKGKILKNNLDESTIKINPGNSILFYTDGLTDLKINTNSDDSLDAVKDIIAAEEKHGTNKVIEKLGNEINDYINDHEQFDDITIIMLKRNSH